MSKLEDHAIKCESIVSNGVCQVIPCLLHIFLHSMLNYLYAKWELEAKVSKDFLHDHKAAITVVIVSYQSVSQ